MKEAKLNEDGTFELYFSNEIERTVSFNNENYVIGLERLPIMPNTWRKIGSLTINTGLILSEQMLEFQISTEDYTKNQKYSVLQLLKNDA